MRIDICLFLIFVFCFITDLRNRKIYSEWILMAFAANVYICHRLNIQAFEVWRVFAGVVSFLSCIPACFWGSLGGGDAVLMGICGYYAGLVGVIFLSGGLFVAAISVCIGYRLHYKKSLKENTSIPLAPIIIGGYLIAYIAAKIGGF